MHISPLKRKLGTAREKDPNLRKLISHRRPSLAWGDTPAPSGNRSPDLLLPGPELSRGFSRSASSPQGPAVGGAITSWSLLTPVGVAEAALALATGPAIPASGSIPISAFLRLIDCVMAQTRALGAAAVELLWIGRYLSKLALLRTGVEVSVRGKQMFLNVVWPDVARLLYTLCVLPAPAKDNGAARPRAYR